MRALFVRAEVGFGPKAQTQRCPASAVGIGRRQVHAWCVCVCMYVCMCMCICVYVCVYVCMCMCMLGNIRKFRGVGGGVVLPVLGSSRNMSANTLFTVFLFPEILGHFC